MRKYDYLIIGSGLFGSVFARTVSEQGARCLMLERRPHVGGNVHTADIAGIKVHTYGPHIFHTADERIWKYVNKFTSFYPYRHKVLANYKGKLFSMPFNMMTYYQMWGCSTPKEAEAELSRQRVHVLHPKNLEEYALSQIGPDLYHTLVYGYTKKQWFRDPKDLPKSIFRRLPCRMTYNDRYYNDEYEGIPTQGYSHLVENLIDGIDVRINSEFSEIQDWRTVADKLVYSGSIDELFDNRFGPLEYRSLDFRNEVVHGDFQGVTQMNYTSEDVPYTRIVEHKHFDHKHHEASVITYEYPVTWEPGKPRYYPINDEKNNALYAQYKALAKESNDIIVGGRLGSFQYYDMDQAIAQALHCAEREMGVHTEDQPVMARGTDDAHSIVKDQSGPTISAP